MITFYFLLSSGCIPITSLLSSVDEVNDHVNRNDETSVKDKINCNKDRGDFDLGPRKALDAKTASNPTALAKWAKEEWLPSVLKAIEMSINDLKFKLNSNLNSTLFGEFSPLDTRRRIMKEYIRLKYTWRNSARVELS